MHLRSSGLFNQEFCMSSTFKTRFSPLLLAGLMATAGFAVFAQTTPAAPADGAPKAQRGMGGGMGHGQRDPAKMQQMMEKRQAELKASLKIEPAQEAAWTAFNAAHKPPADMAQRRDAMRASMDKLTTPERIEHMKAMRTMRDAEMAKREQATKDFYAVLTPEQKKTFDTRGKMGGPGHGERRGQAGGHNHAEGGSGHKMGGMGAMDGHKGDQKGGHNHS
jgi:periplasmic protein CpxP/Spy